jgi:hypothetical protein
MYLNPYLARRRALRPAAPRGKRAALVETFGA